MLANNLAMGQYFQLSTHFEDEILAFALLRIHSHVHHIFY